MLRIVRDGSRTALALLGILVGIGGADEFDRLEGEALTGASKHAGATRRDRLTIAEIAGLPNVLKGTRSALIVATTDAGNPSRLLVAPALRKRPGGDDEPVLVLVLERFATFEAPRATTRLARGRDLILFDGFLVDLDTGQVVPEGLGGDLRFRADGPEGPELEVVGGASLTTFTASPVPPSTGAVGPSTGRAVVPGDFAGRYRLFANGQWSGQLDLQVDPDRTVTGQFRSDLHGETYAISGEVAADVPNRVRFDVTLPRARQEYEGYLWTEGKGAMAGTLSMLGRPYGFFAVREGGRVAPDDEDAPTRIGGDDEDAPGRIVVEVRPGNSYLIGDRKLDDAGALTGALREAVAAEPATWVVIKMSPDSSFDAILRARAAARSAGVLDIRLDPQP